MVELEKIRDEGTVSDADIAADMLSHDAARLKRLIEKHMLYTDSARARHILDNWDSYLPKFVKVIPTDYRRALTEMKDRPQAAPAQKVSAVAGE